MAHTFSKVAGSSNQNKTHPRRRRSPKKHQKAQNKPWGEGRPDWPQEEFETHHCNECHFNHEGTYHWCTFIPGLDSDTCPICNKWEIIDPFKVHPLLFITHSPIATFFEPALKNLVTFIDNFDYHPFWKRAIVYFAIQFLTFIIVKKF